MKKTAIALTLFGILGSQAVWAQQQECSTPALMSASQDIQNQVEAFAHAQEQQGVAIDEVMNEMQQVMVNADVETTLAKHVDELEQMDPGSEHQPSQALCDDMYAMYERMEAEITERQ